MIAKEVQLGDDFPSGDYATWRQAEDGAHDGNPTPARGAAAVLAALGWPPV